MIAEFAGQDVNARIRFRMWSGTVGSGTMWGGQAIHKVGTSANGFEVCRATFWHKATSTASVNLNLAGARFSTPTSGNTVTVRLNASSFWLSVWEIGDGAVVANL